jgi:uncharacterized protein YkwD
MIHRRFRGIALPLLAAAICAVAGCAGGAETYSSQAPPPSSPPNPFEQALFDKVNAYRASRGLKQLKMYDLITAQARLHSINMAYGRVQFGHDGFKDRANRIRSYLSVLDIAENLAVNKGYEDPVDVAFRTLMASPGHRHNIEGNYDMTGVGVTKNSDGQYYFTQIFVDGAGRFR